MTWRLTSGAGLFEESADVSAVPVRGRNGPDAAGNALYSWLGYRLIDDRTVVEFSP